MFKQPKTPKRPSAPASPPTQAQETALNSINSLPFIAPIGYLTAGQGLTRKTPGIKKMVTGV